jgi:hypothetical protein
MMQPDEKDLILIEKYLQGKLKAEDLRYVEEKLANDNAFAEWLAWEQDIKRASLRNEAEELKAHLKLALSQETAPQGQQTYHTPEVKLQSRRFGISVWWYWVAASLVLLLVAYGVLFYSPPGHSPETLFATYYQPYPNVEQPLSRGNDSPGPFQLYEQGQYRAALALLDSIDSDAALFYSGQCHLALQEPAEALRYFERVERGTYTEAARWYAALSALKSGNVTQSQQILELVERESAFYRNNAQALRRALSELP